MEELARAYESGFAMALHSDIIVPYLHSFGTDEQKQQLAARLRVGRDRHRDRA